MSVVLGAAAVFALARSGPGEEVRPQQAEAPLVPDAGREEAPFAQEVDRVPVPFSLLRWLHRPKTPPNPGDWLAEHREPGQTFAQWARADPVRALPERRTIYLQPVGGFSRAQQRIVDLTADYVARYFGLPVKVAEPIPAEAIPASARRRNPHGGQTQIWTQHVLLELIERRPDDAVAYIALTGEDLFPDPSWNFVFGYASLRERVGVWSMWRFGDPGRSPIAFEKTLRRTLTTAVHELGHMFSILHCVRYECVMNGINHEEEAARAPLEPCPDDLAKLCSATGCDPVARFDALIEFWEPRKGEPEPLRYMKSARALLVRDGG